MKTNPHLTPLASLTDEEYLSHLHSKENPTFEDVESAIRLEMLLNSYSDLLEKLMSGAVQITDGVAVQ